jgi:DHA2 family multidrug resistance protein
VDIKLDHGVDKHGAGQMIGHAYLLSSIELFWICGWLSLAVIGLAWLAKRSAVHDGPIAAD